MIDPYLYPESDVLRNLADIRNEETLREMEADYTLSRLSDVVVADSVRKFDFESLCELHYSIFQDVYDWQGSRELLILKKRK